MGREIEYRLWDPAKKIMLECYELIFVQGGIKVSDGCTTQGWAKVNDTFKEKLTPSLVLLEYTGLKDKNGKKIYEGDICRDSMGWVFEVLWDNENARFIGCQSKPRGDTYICYVGRVPFVEIIGNIYENPEIIEEEQHGKQ